MFRQIIMDMIAHIEVEHNEMFQVLYPGLEKEIWAAIDGGKRSDLTAVISKLAAIIENRDSVKAVKMSLNRIDNLLKQLKAESEK